MIIPNKIKMKIKLRYKYNNKSAKKLFYNLNKCMKNQSYNKINKV